MIYICFLSVLTIIFWLIANWPINKILNDSYSIFLSLGQITGLLGMNLFAFNLILSARIKFLEKFFGGLNQIYKIHHQIGGISFILMMVHPVLLLISRLNISLEYSRELVIPGTNFNTDLGVISLLSIMTLLVLTFYVNLPYQIWKFTHKFTGVVFIISAVHGFRAGSTLSQSTALWLFMLVIAITGISAYLYRTVFFRFLVKRYKYKVSNIKKLTKNVVQIILSPIDNPIEYLPGQFIFVSFKSSKVTNEDHPFSIASANTKEITIISKIEGDYTEQLMNLETDTEALIEGPFGRFSYNFYPNPNQIWIAGGIGVTPFIGMSKGIEKLENYNVDLYLCIKDQTEKLGIPIKKANLKLFYSKTMGHITAEYIKNNSKNFDVSEFFICGPLTFMKSLRAQLNKLGIKNGKIHTEEFSFD